VVESIAPPRFDDPALPESFLHVAAAAVAKIIDTVDQTRGIPVQHEELEPFTWALVDRLEQAGPDALPRARATLANAARTYLQTLAGYDVVLTPTLGTAPWRIGHLSPLLDPDELVRRTTEIVGFTPIQNAAGCPAMSVPLWFPDGELPIGAHFAAAPGADALLLGLAYQLEAARPWRDRWAPFSIPRLRDR
jgi:amidase